MELTEKKLIYLYCVTSKAPKLEGLENLVDKLYPNTKGFGVGVYFVYHQGLYVVVSEVKESEFGEEDLKRNLVNFEWIKAKVTVHEEIMEGVMKYTCLVPFKFGTIFNTEDNLKTMLEIHAEELKTNLKNLEGKEEWGLKVYYNLEKLRESIIKEEAEIFKIEQEINSSSPGKAYLLKRKKEELVEDVANKRNNEYIQDSFKILKQISFEARINKLLPKEVTEREDDMVLNSAFLVDKSKITEFIQAVEDLKTKYNHKGLNFNCTGPWPPYNFTAIKGN